MISTVLPSLALCLSMFAVPLQVTPKPSPRENVETTVVEALRLLQSKDYRTFLQKYFPPEWVKAKMAEPGGLNAWVDGWAANSLGNVLGHLKQASTLKPTYDEAKTTAIFRLTIQEGTASFTKDFKMVKIGRYWYIEPRQ
jgi:hypothetical protein